MKCGNSIVAQPACHAIIVSTDQNPGAVSVFVAVSVTDIADGILAAAIGSTSAIHWDAVGSVGIDHDFLGCFSRTRVLQEGKVCNGTGARRIITEIEDSFAFEQKFFLLFFVRMN
jgi:hypothetical protein